MSAFVDHRGYAVARSTRRQVVVCGLLMLSTGLLVGCDAAPTAPETTEPGEVVVANVKVAPGAVTVARVGETAKLSASATDTRGRPVSGVAVEWISLHPAVATVDSLGLVTSLAAGTAKVVARSGELVDSAEVRVEAVYPVPRGTVSDCSADVTQGLHAWIASVPDGSTLEFGKDACYRIDGGMIITDRNDLTFEGNGSTFRVFTEGHGQRANWTIRGGSNIVFRDMIARGANGYAGAVPEAYVKKLEWQHGYRLRGVQGAVLDNVQAYDVYGDFVNLSHDDRVAFPGPPNRDVIVRNSHFERNGRYGISVTNAEGFIFEDNYVGDVRWSGFNIELNGHVEYGRNIHVERNRFGRLYHSMFVAQGAGFDGHVGNVTIRGNVMEVPLQFCLRPISIRAPTRSDGTNLYWRGWVIEGNVLRPNRGSPGIEITRLRDVVVRSNMVDVGTVGGCNINSRVGIDVYDSHVGTVEDNSITGPGRVLYSDPLRIDSISTGFRVGDNYIH
jgi:hypothetical protein